MNEKTKSEIEQAYDQLARARHELSRAIVAFGKARDAENDPNKVVALSTTVSSLKSTLEDMPA